MKRLICYCSKESSELSFILFDTCLGWMGVVGSPDGLRRVILPQESKEAVVSQVGGREYPFESRDFASFGDLPQRLKRYLEAEPVDFPDKLDLAGTTRFQQSVWQITRAIPYAETRSYAWVAGQLGLPRAARAVGQALGRNPVPIVVPCHRVIGSDGGLVGFGGGVETKKYLLRLEKAHA